jgi:hypothetical protein
MLADLCELLDQENSGASALSFSLSRRIGRVVCRFSADGFEVSEGELLDLSAWDAVLTRLR